MSRGIPGIVVVLICGCSSAQSPRFTPEPARRVAFEPSATNSASTARRIHVAAPKQLPGTPAKVATVRHTRHPAKRRAAGRKRQNPNVQAMPLAEFTEDFADSSADEFEFAASEPLEFTPTAAGKTADKPAVQPVSLVRELSADLQPAGLDDVPPPPSAAKPTMLQAGAEPLEIASSQEIASQETTAIAADADTTARYPIDLPTTLKLAGAENWSVQLAAEEIQEATARLDAARAMWLPSLNLAVAWTKHDGPLQATNGSIQDISRNSLFVGGGAVVQNAPLAGGAGGPSRMQVDLSLADAIFQPLAALQSEKLAHSAHNRVFNDTQLAAALAYLDLVAAQARVRTSQDNFHEAAQLVGMTEAFVTGGKAAAGEVQRVQVVMADRERQQIQTQLSMQLASTELARILQLDELDTSAGSVLQSPEPRVVPLELVEPGDLASLIAQGQTNRPEAAEQTARVDVSGAHVHREKWRPWLPHLNVGVSAGNFGGGTGGSVQNDSGRSDIDALLVWQLRNLGAGNRALQRSTRSRYEQELIKSYRVRDVIAAEVKAAFHTTKALRPQIDIAQKRLATATDVYERNITRIRNMEGLPIEAIQALNALAAARFELIAAVIDYNKSQFSLLYAIGSPLN